MNMENNQNQWQQCLDKIQQHLLQKEGGQWVFDTWFAPITLETYNPTDNILMLGVPSTYVYEFIEHYYVNLLQMAVVHTFGPKTRVQYHLHQNADGLPVDFVRTPAYQVPTFHIPDAERRLRDEFTRHLKHEPTWLPAYNKVASWLDNNKGRGLLLVGTTGLGKSVIVRHVLPAIFQCPIPVVDASDLHRRLDELTRQRCVVIDNLGKEDAKVYGQPDRSFYHLCDAAERLGILLIIATNLSTTPKPQDWSWPWPYPTSIQERYGLEVVSRLRSLTRAIEFKGDDLR